MKRFGNTATALKKEECQRQPFMTVVNLREREIERLSISFIYAFIYLLFYFENSSLKNENYTAFCAVVILAMNISTPTRHTH